jgi:serine/threonine-protein kinase
MVARVLLSEPTFPDGFPAEARAICAQAMRRDPGGRHESAEALRVAVEAYLRHRGSRRIAAEARRSLARLRTTLENEPPSEDRALAVFNLLGECRFGYRSALSAWPDNEDARAGLDRALLAVVDHELGHGEPAAAAALLREVSAAPAEVAARVEAAVRARGEQEERLRKLTLDADATVGTRTRMFGGVVFGGLWILVPLLGWARVLMGGAVPSHGYNLLWSAFFVALGLGFFAWARDTMTKTLLNRRLSLTVGLCFVAQVVLLAGAWAAGASPELGMAFMMFSWSVTEVSLAVWLEPWFGVPAAVCAATFLVSAARPRWVLPLMSFDQVVLTAVVLFVWFPRQDLERIRERRLSLRRRARQWLVERVDGARGALPPGSGEGE